MSTDSLTFNNTKPKVIAVIGSNYGDEGKGATVNHLVKKYDSNLVVRFNGANQAGHTVTKYSPDGSKLSHVFSSYGSGTLRGAHTYISEHCLINPKAIHNEKSSLEEKLHSKVGNLLVHPSTNVITPWDIAINQFLERGRGDARHGSCGMGVGEAMLRVTTPTAPKLTVSDLMSIESSYSSVIEIRNWFNNRIKEEAKKGSFTYLSEPQRDKLLSLVQTPTELFLAQYEYFPLMKNITFSVLNVGNIASSFLAGPIIMEGAQGLLLDEDDDEHQPHVTWSKTGLDNVINLCSKHGLELVQVNFVTRPYLTRHGQGPMLAGIPLDKTEDGYDFNCIDHTNKPNEYQGKLRFAHMDWNKFADRIRKEIKKTSNTNPPVFKVVLTCMDQIDSEPSYRFHTSTDNFHIRPNNLPDYIKAMTGLEVEVIDGMKG